MSEEKSAGEMIAEGFTELCREVSDEKHLSKAEIVGALSKIIHDINNGDLL